MTLPATISEADFDTLHDQPQAWRAVIETIARQVGHRDGPIIQSGDGTVLVALLGHDRVLKLYPPFLRDHHAFECAMLELVHGRVNVATPQLLVTGERQGWPYLVMTQLVGQSLDATWKTMAERERLDLLTDLGALTAQVHSLPVEPLVPLAPRWDEFITLQRSHCEARQRRTGLPVHLLAQVSSFIDGELPAGLPVPVTGEYTPVNLFTQRQRLVAMFDFGDGLVGPREYDWLGPLCFLAAGDQARCAAYLAGYGTGLDETMRLSLLRLFLLHRYSNLPAQIALDRWQHVPTFEELASFLWPV